VKHERLAAAGEAVAYLSHHIRNILQGMQGGADVVEMSIKRGSMDSVVSGWGMVRRNLDRIYLLALNMLTFSKDRQPKIETVQINRVIEDVVSLAQHKATERHVILLTELEEMPPIPIDEGGMHQVIHNMVLNAIDAMHDTGGRIMISTKYQVSPPQVTVTVSDTGPGIPDDQIGSIFDPFHSSKGHGGTGLGLAAAKKIVSELNGQIRVETKVGEGTSFHITLPAEHVRLADSGRTHHG
jgi:signal transduction histidine kinase